MGEEKMMKIPYFSKGTAASLQYALSEGVFSHLDKALFYFATDTEQWILVEPDKTVHTINGADSSGSGGGVERVVALPPKENAKVDTLYILGDVVYTFDGIDYYPTYWAIERDLPPETTIVEYIQMAKEEAIATANLNTEQHFQLTVVQGGG